MLLIMNLKGLRSSAALLLTIPKSRIKTFSNAAFSHYASSCWISLPEDLKPAENIDIFKCRRKTHLFSLAVM
ncbi:hypothetical protein LDENG_00091080 [Lucifuga dentata]|nr:hypothetical protein LDENG_00091080 [Lucifuga dentata]